MSRLVGKSCIFDDHMCGGLLVDLTEWGVKKGLNVVIAASLFKVGGKGN